MSHEPSAWEPDSLIGVDIEDRVLGPFSKELCHRAGLLHRAFSVLIFDHSGRLLLQRRAPRKPLWPLFWSNSCCSHPRFGEDLLLAAHRRLDEELGLDTDLEVLFRFHYFARYESVGFEHELCTVLAGRSDSPVVADEDEIAEWRFVGPEQIHQWMEDSPGDLSPWFEIEWQRIRADHAEWLRPASSAC
jgi:isopentenyl-diphosphate delta-isomerase